MKSKKRVVVVLACVMMIAVLAIACAPARRPMGEDVNYRQNNTLRTPGTEPYPGQMPRTGVNGNDDNLVDDGLNPTRAMDMTIRQQLEEKVRHEVEEINGVNNAVVLINGNTAYVGIDAGRNITDNRMNDLKDQVIDRTRRIDNRITRVYVSSDLDVTERLRGYGTEVRAGRPITGFIDEIEEMFRRPLPRS